MIKSGRGWRLGYCPENACFVALVGADTWAMELTRSEWYSFCSLLESLLTTIALTEPELADQENFCCDLDSEFLSLQASGYPDQWSLRLELRSGRRMEGFWHYPAMLELWGYIQAEHLPMLK